jgi:hypothetical protein
VRAIICLLQSFIQRGPSRPTMSLSCSLDTRPFQGLVSALNKRLFTANNNSSSSNNSTNAQFTNDSIAEQLYAGLELERAEIDLEISSIEQVGAPNIVRLPPLISHAGDF